MDHDRHILHWRDQFIGTITEVGWIDFPWVGGRIEVAELSKEMREVLDYVDRESKTDDGLRDWPFPEEFLDHWRIVKPDGTSVEICLPIIDFADGSVTWR